jgi:hypothetical protein
MRKIRKMRKKSEALETLKYIQELDKLIKRHKKFYDKCKNGFKNSREALEAFNKGFEFDKELEDLTKRFEK